MLSCNSERYDASDWDAVDGAPLILPADLFGTQAAQVIVRARDQNYRWHQVHAHDACEFLFFFDLLVTLGILPRQQFDFGVGFLAFNLCSV